MKVAALLATAALVVKDATACDNEWYWDDECYLQWWRDACDYELNDPSHDGWFFWDDGSETAYWVWRDDYDYTCYGVGEYCD